MYDTAIKAFNNLNIITANQKSEADQIAKYVLKHLENILQSNSLQISNNVNRYESTDSLERGRLNLLISAAEAQNGKFLAHN